MSHNSMTPLAELGHFNDYHIRSWVPTLIGCSGFPSEELDFNLF